MAPLSDDGVAEGLELHSERIGLPRVQYGRVSVPRTSTARNNARPRSTRAAVTYRCFRKGPVEKFRCHTGRFRPWTVERMSADRWNIDRALGHPRDDVEVVNYQIEQNAATVATSRRTAETCGRHLHR
ncbi:MAG: hypothetical protein WA988_12165 [Candidatus Nanopelagicales bacterium]